MSIQEETNFFEFSNVMEEILSKLYKDGYVNGTLKPNEIKKIYDDLSEAWDTFRLDCEYAVLYGDCDDDF